MNQALPKLVDGSNEAALAAILARSHRDLERAERVAARIVADVRRRGDRAVRAWSDQFASAAPSRFAPGARVPAGEVLAAWRRAPRDLRAALQGAAANIRRMAQWQLPRPWLRRMRPGVQIGQVVRPLESAACYVPGGRHPLPSTLLMTAIPARVAGVERVVVACPRPDDAVLAAAHVAQVDEIYCLGGAQAVAALAYGTQSIAPVAKIAGPGNSFVTAAKRLVAADCGIDFLAGPTEVLLVAAGDENAGFLAADLLAQAEHDPQAAAWLVTPSRALARRVQAAVAEQLAACPNPTAAAALRSRGAIVLTRDLRQAMAIANRLAPEHITVPARCLGQVRHAGSIFVGEHAPQAVGDYMSGTNHVLPTGRLARLRGGLSVADFVKVITVQKLTAAGLRALGPAIITLAQAEGLAAHASSVALRLAPRRRPAR